MKKILLSLFVIPSMTAMAQSIYGTPYTPVEIPESSYDIIGNLNSALNGSFNSNFRQYSPQTYPQRQQRTPKTRLVKGTYYDGMKWRTASVRIAEDQKGMYIYSTNSGGIWQRCGKSYLHEISEFDDMSQYFNYSAQGGIYTFYF